jgi:hypothetical protein
MPCTPCSKVGFRVPRLLDVRKFGLLYAFFKRRSWI